MQSVFFLSACGPKTSPFVMVPGNNYKERHPIVMKTVEQGINLPILSGRGNITLAMRETINGFLDRYKADSSSVLYIMIPNSTADFFAIKSVVSSIRGMISSKGIPERDILERIYSTDHKSNINIIRMSYYAVRPVTDGCGKWLEDMLNSNMSNRNWSNFGCAFQHNLAAQVVSPIDLFIPRGMMPPDAAQRDHTMRDYREK
ncbi:CpaD family pilus assembly protein [Candidatus Liberibacter sp.]|uniref:CpaD family pilus assembly protein n=1 Tax=Candidatus Liberibacter sp. TaxID=34022 RepID=UPI0015F6039E|nr:CpaD family pilus assembly protein [Candidatus Liberibacter sp.]MBA5723933.1 CpaD family pilus assembly protein [Candidatus Liberibacter sp.]